MTVTNNIYPTPNSGKRFDPELHQTLPYDQSREAVVCGHSPFYGVRFYQEQPFLCGLCLFRQGIEAEVPTRIHQFKVLAANGNPETTPKMVSHLHVVMGLKPPRPDESLEEYRKRRSALAREQYTARSPLDHTKLVKVNRSERFSKPAPGLFPVTSALWQLMGYQPPLGRVLIAAVTGKTEIEIARQLGVSVFDIYIRMAKAIRVGMGFIPNGGNQGQRTRSSTGRRRSRRSKASRTHQSWLEALESEG